MPLFSIIIPTFNVQQKLIRSLESIRSQNFSDLEIIVQDGASTDGTPEFLSSQSDVKGESVQDSGVYDAMNRAIERSSGRFLYFLGAGDEIKAGILEQMADAIRLHEAKSKQPLFIYGDVFWTALGRRYDGPFGQWKMTQRCVCHQAIFYGREIFGRVGHYDLRYKIGADFALNMKIFGDKSIKKLWIDTVVAEYEGGGLSSNVRDEEFIKDLPLLIKQNFSWPVRFFYRLRRISPRGLKRMGAPIMRLLKWVPDEKLRSQMPGEKEE